MMKFLLVLVASFTASLATAQGINLVGNPGFDMRTGCPGAYSDGVTYAVGWTGLDTGWRAPDWDHARPGNPEYCHMCFNHGWGGAPSNNAFYQYPRSDSGMMQVQTLGMLSDSFFYARDYLQGRLARRLTRGKTYEVSFYTVAEERSHFYHNHLGAYLDDGSIDTFYHGNATVFPIAPQIDDSTVITDTFNWTRVHDTFTANGTESFITIANFTSMYRIRSVPDCSPYYGTALYSWYLIDDVSVVDCGNIPDAGGNMDVAQGGAVYLGPREKVLPYTWYVQGNPTPIDSGSGTWVSPSVTTTYVLEQKLCGVTRYDTVTVTVHTESSSLVHWRGVGTKLYPSPASEVLYVDNARSAEITIIDVTGRVVLQLTATEDKQPVDVGTLMPGVYGVQLVDGVTGERVVGRFVK